MANLTPGSRLGPYEIVASLGAGGMGEVYKARDIRLNRTVAIKISQERFSERFAREAQIIATLNHPHICMLHDVGPDYLVMEYVDGEPVRGPLPPAEAVRVGLQIVAALEEAHSKHILHRDLKPANILLTKSASGRPGAAKLLDFGLAKVMSDPDATQTMTISGTPLYMSPEQAEGKLLDERSDIFSFGLVLYEMLSGRRAFESLAGLLRDNPAELSLPGGHIAMRCLAKKPQDRFPTMAALKAALERVPTKAAEQQPSIAVLPFANLSGDKEQEYFSDGLAEEIINALAHISGLRVTARTSAFYFKGKDVKIADITRELGVEHLLEGSVRRAGNRIRVTAQLIKAADGFHLWSERYDRDLTDIFLIQDEIAKEITAALQVKISSDRARRERYIPTLPAYEAYLKARHHWAKITPESLARSKEYYEQALTLDPGFALAHVGLADYYLLLAAGMAVMPAHQAMPLVRASAEFALDIDPSFPEAHGMLGLVSGVYDYNWKEAERRFQLAMTHERVPAQVRWWHSWFNLLPNGLTEEAVEEAKLAVGEDPLNIMSRIMLADSLTAAHRYEDAFEELCRALELDENSWFVCGLLAENYLVRGMLAEGLIFAEKAYSLAEWAPNSRAVFASLLAKNGQRNKADEVLQRLKNTSGTYGVPRGLFYFHALCGELDQAADWAAKAIEQRDVAVGLMRRLLDSSPQWPALAKKMNLLSA